MEPTQISVGTSDGSTHIGIGTSDDITIKSEVDGQTKIIITDLKPKKLGQGRYPLIYYNGSVRSGTQRSQPVEAYIFAFKSADGSGDVAKTLHQQCSTFDHPNVMRSLGYGRGSQRYSKYMFVAFPTFDLTLSDLLVPGSIATEMGRLSVSFIDIISQVVKGLEALHGHNLCCQNLDSTHVAIKFEDNSATAKIWRFSACTSDKNKNKCWVKLGELLRQACDNNHAHGPDSIEIEDLCKKLMAGQLKGVDILRHCAMLRVQLKFENVLSLWLHVSVRSTSSTVIIQQDQAQNQTSNTTYTLEEYLDLVQVKSKRPNWLDNRRKGVAPKTFRKVLDEVRDIIEHEDAYIPPDVTKKHTFGEIEEDKREADLEHYFRKAWAKEFLKIQFWASDPTAKLC